MLLVEFESLAVGRHPLRHLYTGDRAIYEGLAANGQILVRFDDDPDVVVTHPEVMADATKPAPAPARATDRSAGYTRCIRCQGVYDIGPGDPDICPDCGPVTWEPEEIPAP